MASSRKPAQSKPTKAQQGARGRVVASASSPPIQVPRGSKVPAQDSDFLTTAQGVRVAQTDDSLKVGSRGPTLMEDFHFREKIMHFDHRHPETSAPHSNGAGILPRFRQNPGSQRVANLPCRWPFAASKGFIKGLGHA